MRVYRREGEGQKAFAETISLRSTLFTLLLCGRKHRLKKTAITIVLLFAFCLSFAQTKWDSYNYAALNKTHDVNVPPWGPYTKKYMGISHIADSAKGLRFDLSVMPGFSRQKVLVPNVLYESGYYPWNASADLNFFSFREELEWKDKVYTDVSFAPFDDRSRIIRIACTNNTAVSQNLVVHLMESMQYPEVNPLQVVLPEGSKWISGVDYKTMSFASPRPQDNLTYDGWRKGEIRSSEVVGGSGLGKGFGKERGDKAVYGFDLATDFNDAFLLIRYKVAEGARSGFVLEGIYNDTVMFAGTPIFTELRLPLKKIKKGIHHLSLTATGGAEIEIDGFTVAEKESIQEIYYFTSFNPIPQIWSNLPAKQVLLKYADARDHYGISWKHEGVRLRQFFGDAVDVALPLTVNNHGDSVFIGNDKGHYTDIFLHPIPLKPGEVKVLYALVSSGTKEQIQALFNVFQNAKDHSAYFKKWDTEVAESIINSTGKKYSFGQQIIKATTLQNIVFPVYTAGQYIKHFTPGRWWNSLYTWDAGFIGLGMAGIDTAKAIQILNAYTTDAADSNAFIHHGSVVPVQAFLYQDLYNRTGSKALLSYFYPRLKKYYLFYAGRSGSSTMRMPSNLIRSWDYFYNSGGWDDYPPQKAIRGKKEFTDVVTPVINTSMAIRFAKILVTAAAMLGLNEDVEIYTQDIAAFSTALQKHAWDGASGYFGYVVHDKAGKPQAILRTGDGVNYNMGMDGTYPLVAGIATKEQTQTLVNNLFSPKKLSSPVGLSAVDQSAPYYSKEGYWNGTVWFPHQWFYWKAMLDMGEGDKAFSIAQTALNTWKKEAELSYHSAEHFSIETGRGEGWHQFSALSTPVAVWHDAYFRPGTITTGFNGWIEGSEFRNDYTSLTAVINFSAMENGADILVCMKEGKKYKVFINSKEIMYKEPVKGLLQIKLSGQISHSVQLKIVSQ